MFLASHHPWKRSWAGLLIVLVVASAIRLWNLDRMEFGNLYYAATVRSMTNSWHNFLYASFDPGGFLSVDKPPLAFWLQVLSVKLLGYHGISLHLPQAIQGIIATVILYGLTLRVVGPWGASVAGLTMALSPANVAADRSNLADSCLILVLLLAAWATLHALETDRWRWLALSAALVGLGFNVKLTAAYLIVPSLYLLYCLASRLPWRNRLVHLALSTAVTLVVSLSWVAVVDLTPKASRPYVGDTPDNSALSLALGRRSFQHAGGPGPPPAHPIAGERPPEEVLTGHGGRPGPVRLANRDMAGHITWLIPFATVGLVAFVLQSRPWHRRNVLHLCALLWVGWFGTCAIVFSFAHAPIHPYYLNMMGPPLAGLVGIGAVHLEQLLHRHGVRRFLPIAAVMAALLWQSHILARYPRCGPPLLVVLVVGSALSVIVMMIACGSRSTSSASRSLGMAGLSLGLCTLLLCPTLWSATTVLAPGGRMVPIADPILLQNVSDEDRGYEEEAGLKSTVEFLRAHRRGERFLVATSDIHLAAPIIARAHEPVMAYGGFTGHDPILSAERFEKMVRTRQVRFVLLADAALGLGRIPANEGDVTTWVRTHGREVSPDQWQPRMINGPLRRHQLPAPWGPTREMVRRMYTGAGVRLYDCQPVTSAHP